MLSGEYGRCIWAAEAECCRRIAAAVWDPNDPEARVASVIVDREIELEGTQTEPVRAGITTLIDLAGHSATDPKAARELPDAMQSLRSKKRGR
jgi:hypothetical protein